MLMKSFSEDFSRPSDAKRGEIALAPSFRIPNGIPEDELYLLKMSGVSQVQLRA